MMTLRRLASFVAFGVLALPLVHCTGDPQGADCFGEGGESCEATSEVASELGTVGTMTSTERQRILSIVGLKGMSRWVKPALSDSSRRVTTVAQLKTALADANAGNLRRIVLATATYSSPGLLAIRRSGVQIMSETLNGAIIEGQVLFDIDQADDVVIMGLRFRNTSPVPNQRSNVFHSKNSERLRITRIRSGSSGPGSFLSVDYGSHDFTFDFNQVAFHKGLVIGIKSPATAATGASSKRARILHNEFSDIADPEGDKLNETSATENGEVMMLGLGYPDGPDQTISSLVEYNLMERALGDEEAISVKSNGNRVRFNVMRDSDRASYNVRGGHRNELNGNILEGGTKHGIGIAGSGNVVSGNDVQAAYPLLLQYEQEAYMPTVDSTIVNNRFHAKSYLIRLRQSDPVLSNPRGNLLENNVVSFSSYVSPIVDARSFMTWSRFRQLNTVRTNPGLP